MKNFTFARKRQQDNLFGVSFLNAGYSKPASRALRVDHPYSPLKTYNIQAVADYEFYSSAGISDTGETIRAMDYQLNIASGVYYSELGIQLQIVGYTIFRFGDPITEVGDTGYTSLVKFKDYMNTYLPASFNGRQEAVKKRL